MRTMKSMCMYHNAEERKESRDFFPFETPQSSIAEPIPTDMLCIDTEPSIRKLKQHYSRRNVEILNLINKCNSVRYDLDNLNTAADKLHLEIDDLQKCSKSFLHCKLFRKRSKSTGV